MTTCFHNLLSIYVMIFFIHTGTAGICIKMLSCNIIYVLPVIRYIVLVFYFQCHFLFVDFFFLQIEQICQKALKRERTVEYVIGKDYTGSWFPVMMGWRVCVNFPCTDEPRIKVKVGDRVKVTRWKKYAYSKNMLKEYPLGKKKLCVD